MTEKKENILILVNSLKAGGSNKVGIDVANGLSTKYDVTIFYLLNNDIGFNINKNINIIGISILGKKWFIGKSYLLIFIGILYLWVKIFLSKPKAIISSNVETGFIAIFSIFLNKKTKLILTQHEESNFIEFLSKKSKYKFYFNSIKRNFKKVYKMISISNYIKEDLIKYGFNKNKIETIYNPIDIENIQHKSSILENTNNKFGDYIINIGTYYEIKNQIFLIEVFNDIKNEIKENLVFLGDIVDSEYYNLMLEKIHKYKLEDRVFLVGHTKNPYPLLKGAKIYCASSKNEGLPLTLVEALVLGIPIISTENKGSIELIGNNKNGILIKSFNKEDYKTAIKDLLQDRKLKDKYIKNGKNKIKEFEYVKQINKYIDLIKS